MAGRLTLGLYNTYDAGRWHDVMRVAIARAAPVAMAFDCDVATFGFPFEDGQHRESRSRGQQGGIAMRTPAEVAKFVTGSTSIGDGGGYLVDLAADGRLHVHDFPRNGTAWPPRLGKPVLTTPTPDLQKTSTPLELAREAHAGTDHLLVFGLGPRGLPDSLLAIAAQHLELTGKGISMETATALGALPAMIHTHLGHLAGRYA